MEDFDMPQPFKQRTGQQITSGASVITQRPDCAIAIVKALGSWAHFEAILLDLFDTATSQYLVNERNGGIASTSNIAALRAFMAVDTLNLKRMVMRSAIETRITPELLARFDDLMAKARQRAAERNDLAHALWATVDAYPNDILRVTQGERLGRTEEYSRYSLTDFESITARTQTLIGEALALSGDFRAYRATFAEPIRFGG